MPWIYNQANGTLSHDGEVVAVGYSGFGAGKNNGVLQREPNIGPIPIGQYEIGLPFDSQTHGPVCMHLAPTEETQTFGRGGFLLHGDSIEHPGAASHGCIIVPRPARIKIAQSDDRALQIV